jgi:hypothetical protein
MFTAELKADKRRELGCSNCRVEYILSISPIGRANLFKVEWIFSTDL